MRCFQWVTARFAWKLHEADKTSHPLSCPSASVWHYTSSTLCINHRWKLTYKMVHQTSTPGSRYDLPEAKPITQMKMSQVFTCNLMAPPLTQQFLHIHSCPAPIGLPGFAEQTRAVQAGRGNSAPWGRSFQTATEEFIHTYLNKTWKKLLLQLSYATRKAFFFFKLMTFYYPETVSLRQQQSNVSTSGSLLSLPKTQCTLSTLVASFQNSDSPKLINSCQNALTCSQGKEIYAIECEKVFLLYKYI